MAAHVEVGQRVRINEKYPYANANGMNNANRIGAEFTVTGVFHSGPPNGVDSDFYVMGDPNGWGIWGDYIDVVPGKAHTTTTISTLLSWHDEERIVSITNGRGAISLAVMPNPHKVGDVSGSTSLTPEQAEEIAHDLLARVAEIRAVQ